MSCLDVMYQVYGPPQPYFAAAYTPYHQVRVSSRDLGEEWRAPGLRLHGLYAKVRCASARLGRPTRAGAAGMRGLPEPPPVGSAIS